MANEASLVAGCVICVSFLVFFLRARSSKGTAEAHSNAAMKLFVKGEETVSGCKAGVATATISNRCSEIRPAGRDVELVDDAVFSDLRRANGVPDDFVNEGWSFNQFGPGGGKGGTPMVFIGSAYIVKELSEGDHKVLLDVTRSYYEHVTTGASLLCRMLMHFRDVKTKKAYLVMKNEVGGGPFDDMFDLKGCADDKTLIQKGRSIRIVNKRIWNVTMWCGQCLWTPDRVIYYDGKKAAAKARFQVTGQQRTRLLSTMQRDTEWLATEGLMDYSLLVGVKKGSRGSFPSGSTSPMVRQEEDGSETAVFVSVIDFLQKWTTAKVIANAIKVLERNKATIHPTPYAERFYTHFAHAFRALD